MAINRINETDLQGKLVSQLSNRPTDPHSAGGDNMTAQQVKARHDALGLLVKDKVNELLDALNNATVNGEPVTPLSDLITVVVDGVSKSLTAWIENKYSLPLTGIPKDDLSDGVKASLDLADSAYQLPGTGIPATDLAEAIRTILTNAVSQSEFAPVKALAEGAEKAEAAENYSALASLLSAAEKTAYKPGQKFLIGTYGVPDVGVLSVEDTTVSYTYTTDAAFEASLMAGTLQIGYFVLRPVEGKTNLADYATTSDLDALIDALVDGVMSVAEAAYAESATFAQQADLANQINTDREIEDADTACPPVVFGTVGGNAEVQSGLMKFPELRGHTIKWNQLMQNGNFVDDSGWGRNDATYSVSNNILTLTASAQRGLVHHVCSQISGHKYLLAATIKLTTATTDIRFCRSGSVLGGASVSTTDWQLMSYFYDGASTTASAYIGICDNRSSDWDAVQIKNFMLFDLTEIYGAGNEPSTVAEFVRDYPKPYYPYNAGTLLSSKSSSVDFVKRNQCPALDTFFNVLPNTEYEVSGITAGGYLQEFDGNKTLIKTSSEITSTTDIKLTAQTVYAKIQATTYTNVLCYIKWNTPGLPYVPYSKQHITLPNLELRSAGSVYDVLYQQGGGKRRVGTVDLGTLDWYPYGITGHIFRATLSDHITKNAITMTCAKYECLMPYGNPNTGLNIDKSILALDSNGKNIYVRDDNYDNTVEGAGDIFKAAMDGIMLYYGLATETEITVEENPGWTEYADIDNFGTVKFNQSPAQTIPVPQAYFVRYTVNLVEFLDSLYVHCGGDVSKLALVE